MRTYSFIFIGLSTLIGGSGVLLALLTLSPSVVVALAMVGAALGIVAHLQAPRWCAALGFTQARRLHGTILVAVAFVAVGGLQAYLGSAALAAVAMLGVLGVPLVLAAHPDLVQAQRWAVVAPEEPTQQAAPRAPPAEVVRFDTARLLATVSAWPDERLCWAWRASFIRLQLSGPDAAATVVVERQVYLDEIERRHPDAFASWLMSGARAASDPSRHLEGRGRQAPQRDQPPNKPAIQPGSESPEKP